MNMNPNRKVKEMQARGGARHRRPGGKGKATEGKVVADARGIAVDTKGEVRVVR